jgi:hypothetical protein
MRKQKTLKLRDDLSVTVLELTPRDIKNALGLTQKGGELDFEKLLTQDWDDAIAKLAGVIQADPGSLEDLSFSEIADVKDAFMEVNAAFFDLLGSLGLKLGAVGLSSSVVSTEPASYSLSEDTQASSATAGASS